jgi:hypothetical protein
MRAARYNNPVMSGSALATEMAYFKQHLDELLAHHSGKFVLIHGTELAGVFDTMAAAYEVGVQKWGNVPMLIRQVRQDDPIETVPALMHGVVRALP